MACLVCLQCIILRMAKRTYLINLLHWKLKVKFNKCLHSNMLLAYFKALLIAIMDLMFRYFFLRNFNWNGILAGIIINKNSFHYILSLSFYLCYPSSRLSCINHKDLNSIFSYYIIFSTQCRSQFGMFHI